MITQTLKLNLIPGQVLPRVNVSQYDAGTRTLQMLLYNGDQAFNIPVGYGGFVQGTKPDRTGFQYAATVTEGSNVVTLVITQQMTAVSGEVTCELVIANGNDRIATVNFILYVEPAALADDTVISETELPLIEEAAELAQRIDEIVADVEADADRAEAAVEHYPYIGANGNWYVFDLQTEQFVDTTIAATGPQGPQGDDGPTGPQGPTGPTGNGIVSITKTGTSGLVDTYTILFTDGTTTTFTVTNGQNSTVIQTLTNQVKDMNNVYGSKNLLPISLKYLKSINTKGTWNGNVYSYRGVDFTVNSDLQGNIANITTSGTANANSAIDIYGTDTSYGENNFSGMILNGCPSGGGTASTDYRIVASVSNSQDGTGYSTINDTGDGATLTNASYLRIYLRVPNGYSSSLVFKPMIRLASITDDTYEPYAKTNQQLTQDTTALLDNTEVNGAVNILPNKATSQVINGITFTVNDDGTVTANGTATANTELTLNTSGSSSAISGLEASNYKLSGCPSGGGNNTYRLFAKGSSNNYYNDDGNGVSITNDGIAYVRLSIRNGVTVSNLIFKPMITVPSYNGDYVPYAKSNKELTEELEKDSVVVTENGITANFSKWGKVCTISFTGAFNAAFAYDTVFLNIPSGFAPNVNCQMLSTNKPSSVSDRIALNIGSNGTINVAGVNVASGDALKGSYTYITA